MENAAVKNFLHKVVLFWEDQIKQVMGIAPLTDIGVSGFKWLLKHPRQIIGVTPFMLDYEVRNHELFGEVSNDEEWVRRFRPCYTGCWALDAEAQLQAQDLGLPLPPEKWESGCPGGA